MTASKYYVAEGKQKAADFEDLLSSQGFNAHKDKKGPRTIAEMRKEEMAKEMDPEKLKVSGPLDHPIGQSCVTSHFAQPSLHLFPLHWSLGTEHLIGTT